jgi:hypothetical protein
MSLPVSDDFNRASLGANWTTGNGLSAMQILSSTGVGAGVAGNNCGAYWNADTFTAKQKGKVQVLSANRYNGLIFRHGTNYLMLFVRSYDTSYGPRVYRYDAGAYTVVGTSNKAIAQGDYLEGRLESEANGNIDLYINDLAQSFTFTDSSVTAAGPVGVYAWGVDATTIVIDNWSADNIGAGGGGFQAAWARNSNVIIQPGLLR